MAGWFQRWSAFDSGRSLFEWLWWGFCLLFNITGASVMAWMLSYWEWYWQTFNLGGYAIAFLLSIIIIPSGAILAAEARNKWLRNKKSTSELTNAPSLSEPASLGTEEARKAWKIGPFSILCPDKYTTNLVFTANNEELSLRFAGPKNIVMIKNHSNHYLRDIAVMISYAGHSPEMAIQSSDSLAIYEAAIYSDFIPNHGPWIDHSPRHGLRHKALQVRHRTDDANKYISMTIPYQPADTLSLARLDPNEARELPPNDVLNMGMIALFAAMMGQPVDTRATIYLNIEIVAHSDDEEKILKNQFVLALQAIANSSAYVGGLQERKSTPAKPEWRCEFMIQELTATLN